MIAARLNIILSEIISTTQSASVTGCMITDNILVAYECFHTIKRKIMVMKACALSNWTCTKAHDRVEWPFPKEGNYAQIGIQRELGKSDYAMCILCGIPGSF